MKRVLSGGYALLMKTGLKLALYYDYPWVELTNMLDVGWAIGI